MRRRQAVTVTLLIAAMLALSACCPFWPFDDGDAAAAVDHATELLAEAGRDPAALPGAIRFECGPTDAVLGQRLSRDPIHIDLAFAELVPLLEPIGREPPPRPDNPLAGIPAHIDRWETSGDGWTVRWGESNTLQAPDGRAGTAITFVEGGAVSADELRRWVDDEVVVDLRHCG